MDQPRSKTFPIGAAHALRRSLPARLYWTIVVLYAVMIYLLSSLSNPLPRDVRKYFSDLVLHGVEYGFFGFFLAGALRFSFRIHRWPLLISMTVLLGAFYGFTDEWHQRYVPRRYCSIEDWFADIIGVFIGTLVLMAVTGHFKAVSVKR